MTHCYLCGCKLSPDKRRIRRTVKTGEWVRRSYKGDRLSAVQTHYGKRLVCGRCARLLDRRKETGDLLWHLSPFAAVLFLYLLFLFA